ncbi:hypothetical protein LR48_Vigan09g077500 [Vigna angularis]|uniref:Uncharacterized protein n=1 Tax=Phaseolus angularis TaxID=3914 RepID=A0A0L9VAM3_PHAAN|nr:hypothetical protein LR48_Vigan09g077500 [Vigna angularis]
MASSSSSRRKWKVARIARNANPTGWIIDEDIRQKLFSLRKIKTMVSHRYLKLVTVFNSNLKMSDETFCNKIKGVDMKLIKEVWIGIVVYQPISKEGFLFQIWIGHHGLIGFIREKMMIISKSIPYLILGVQTKQIQQKLKKMSGLDGYPVKIDYMSESLKKILGAQVN